jgi:ribonucleoside-triphosphate reductase
MSQVTFSSINFGTYTTPEGQLVIQDILLAQEAGLGKQELSLFPEQYVMGRYN